MKIRKILYLFVSLIIFFVANLKTSQAAGPRIINSNINSETTWIKADSPYVVKGAIYINAPLTIEPGVVVKFSNEAVNNSAGALLIKSSLIAIGTTSEKIIFTSTSDSEYGGDTSIYSAWWSNRYPMSGDWSGIILNDSPGNIQIENALLSYANKAVDYQSVYKAYYKGLTVKNSELKNNNTGIYLRDVEPILENNSIHNNKTGIKVYCPTYSGRLPSIKNSAIYNNTNGVDATGYYSYQIANFDARNNWWGDASGPYSFYFNPSGKGNRIIGRLGMFSPWLNTYPIMEDLGCQENCFSNVMFLPGIKASHLYKNGALGTEDELWIPNFFGNDVNELDLDNNGKSINNVYTRDIVREDPIGNNIYETFADKLESLKNDGTINNYNLFAYDWRQNVEDIAKNGTPYSSEIKSAIATLTSLAESSKSKKVTIIAHSNGGLLAKAIVQELENKGLSDKVDKIILVGSPQLGTPLSLLSMLYGYDEGSPLGLLISRSDARTLAENMPGAYGLLPSKKYFNSMEDPFVSFSSLQTRYKSFIDAYGEKINSFDEFRNFLLGKTDGREKPNKNDVEKENVLNENIFNQVAEMHERLDNWTPPANVEVIQIAGWGLDTISGVNYTEKEKTDCYATSSKIPSCIGIGEYEPIYEPKFTVDGDAVVVAPSALMISNAENVKKYWMNLYEYNDNSIINRDHKNILEVNSIQQFISNIINNTYSTSSLPEFIKTSRPTDYENAQSRLRMSLYSPLDINLYDDAGNHTGPKTIAIDGGTKTIFEEGIPNSYYYQFGDQKYVGFEGGENVHVVMKGYDTGSYTLKLEEVKATENGNEIIAHATFFNLPTTADTTVSFSVPETGLVNMTTLDADIDNDGTSNYKIDKVLNGTAVPPVTIETISDDVDHLVKLNFITDVKTQDFLQIKLRELSHDKNMIEKMTNKNNNNPKVNQIKLLNKKIDDLVVFIQEKFSNTISSLAKDLLIKNLNSVKM